VTRGRRRRWAFALINNAAAVLLNAQSVSCRQLNLGQLWERRVHGQRFLRLLMLSLLLTLLLAAYQSRDGKLERVRNSAKKRRALWRKGLRARWGPGGDLGAPT
jgi:hypothetical protein